MISAVGVILLIALLIIHPLWGIAAGILLLLAMNVRNK